VAVDDAAIAAFRDHLQNTDIKHSAHATVGRVTSIPQALAGTGLSSR
jgi:hypothetical protein